MARLTAADVRSVVFTRPGWGKRGYDPAEVDAFLDRAAVALDDLAAGRPAGMGPDDVHAAVFRKPPVGKRGYAEDQVDGFLDDLEQTLGPGRGAPGIELNGAPL